MRFTSASPAAALTLTLCAASAAILIGFAGCTLAAERGWAPVVTGSLPPAQSPPARSRPGRLIVEPLETAAGPNSEAKSPPAAPVASGRPATDRARTATAAELSPVQQYCANIADAAADARFAWQKKVLADAEQEIEKRIAQLEAKTAEYQRWMARRDEFIRRAQETLVNIYTRMRPDAAALQLAATDEETAAAVLSKLDARTSSTILGEMEPAHAARLTTIMVGAAKVKPASSAKVASDGKKS